jgi:hypothetical protein
LSCGTRIPHLAAATERLAPLRDKARSFPEADRSLDARRPSPKLCLANRGPRARARMRNDGQQACAREGASPPRGGRTVPRTLPPRFHQVLRPYTRVPFEYYLERHPRLAARVTPLDPAIPWGGIDLAVDQNQPADFARLARAENRHDRVWLVLSHNGLNDADAHTTARLSRVLGADRGSTTEDFPGISVTLARESEPVTPTRTRR